MKKVNTKSKSIQITNWSIDVEKIYSIINNKLVTKNELAYLNSIGKTIVNEPYSASDIAYAIAAMDISGCTKYINSNTESVKKFYQDFTNHNWDNIRIYKSKNKKALQDTDKKIRIRSKSLFNAINFLNKLPKRTDLAIELLKDILCDRGEDLDT